MGRGVRGGGGRRVGGGGRHHCHRLAVGPITPTCLCGCAVAACAAAGAAAWVRPGLARCWPLQPRHTFPVASSNVKMPITGSLRRSGGWTAQGEWALLAGWLCGLGERLNRFKRKRKGATPSASPSGHGWPARCARLAHAAASTQPCPACCNSTLHSIAHRSQLHTNVSLVVQRVTATSISAAGAAAPPSARPQTAGAWPVSC